MLQGGPLIGFEAEWYPEDYLLDVEADEDVMSWGTCRKLAQLLEESTGIKSIVPKRLREDKPGTDRTNPRWIVTSDYSLDPLGSVNELPGAEITSPPMPPKTAIRSANKIIDFVDWSGTTNELCGFHWNISLPAMEKLVPFALVALLPEMRLASTYGRARPLERLARHELLVRLAKDETYDARNVSFLNGQFLLNLDKLRFGYVEFRHAGGNWLAVKERLIPSMLVCLDVLRKAHRPNQKLLQEQESLLRVQADAVRSEARNWTSVCAGPLERDGFNFGYLYFDQFRDQYTIGGPTLPHWIAKEGRFMSGEVHFVDEKLDELPFRVALAYLFEAGLLAFP